MSPSSSMSSKYDFFAPTIDSKTFVSILFSLSTIEIFVSTLQISICLLYYQFVSICPIIVHICIICLLITSTQLSQSKFIYIMFNVLQDNPYLSIFLSFYLSIFISIYLSISSGVGWVSLRRLWVRPLSPSQEAHCYKGAYVGWMDEGWR